MRFTGSATRACPAIHKNKIQQKERFQIFQYAGQKMALQHLIFTRRLIQPISIYRSRLRKLASLNLFVIFQH